MNITSLLAKPLAPDIALLFLRVAVGMSMFFGHGWDKIVHFETASENFPSLLGISSEVSLLLVIGAEIGCSTFISLGFFTRLSAIPLVATMIGAIGLVHLNSPFIDMELPLMYLFCFATLMMLGPGKLSLDAIITHQHKKKSMIGETPDAW